MRKIIVLFFLTVFAVSLYSQQAVDLEGYYKGQKYSAKGHKRPDGTVDLTSFKYAPYDKLDSEVKTLKNQKKDLENDKGRLEKEKERLEKQIKEMGKNGGDVSNLQLQLTQKTHQLDSVSNLLTSKKAELESIREELNRFKKSMQDSVAAHASTIGRYKMQLNEKDVKIADLELRVSGKGLNSNTIGLDFAFGSSSIKNDMVKQDFWGSSFSPSIQIMASYCYYFDEASPFAVKVGLGYGSYNGNISASSILDTVKGLVDEDGDPYEARYKYFDLSEEVSLKYLEIPVLFHIGNSYLTNGVQAWLEAGLKAGINVGSSFEGKGRYDCEGYYPGWYVTIHDVEALGFVSNADVYTTSTTTEVSKFVLWGVARAGMSIPLSDKIALQIGAHCGYTLLPVSKGEAVESKYVMGKANMLSGESTRIFNIGGNIGLSFSL